MVRNKEVCVNYKGHMFKLLLTCKLDKDLKIDTTRLLGRFAPIFHF